MENILMMTNPIALIAVEIPQQALDKVGREELQRKAGSRLLPSTPLRMKNFDTRFRLISSTFCQFVTFFLLGIFLDNLVATLEYVQRDNH